MLRFLVLVVSILLLASAAQAGTALKIGLLKFGTVSWEIDAVRHNGFDRANGIAVEPVEFASNDAARLALLSGAVDMIVTDWPWVARQRAEGFPLSFIPYSRAVGTLMVRRSAGFERVEDLSGKRIGVVGGPLDKSWLLLRAFAGKAAGGWTAEPVFGAPALLAEEFRQGRIDAVLTYWHHAARLQAAGAEPFLTVSDMIRGLGISADVPMLGYAFRDDWARREGKALAAFVDATRRAKALLADRRDEWSRLAPLIGDGDPAYLDALQAGYRAGIPQQWGNEERDAAVRLYAVLVSLGGEKLVGRAERLDEGVFWQEVQY